MSWRRLVAIGVIALAVRVVYVALFMRGYSPTSDADSYLQIARAVSHGHGFAFTLPFEFVHATAIRPPLYPTVVAGAMRVFGTRVGVAQGVNMVAGSGAAVLGALIAQRVSGPRAGWYAGLVLALYPPLIANDVTVLVESLALLLAFALVLFLVDGRTVFAGVALGLLMLDRASAQWLLLFLGAWVVWRFGWWHALRFAAVALLVVAPWVARNWVHVGGPVIVATNGFNLNAAYSSEARHDDRFVDGYFDPRFARTRAAAVDEVDLDGMLRRHALHDLRAHPTQLVRSVARNTLQWFELDPARNTDPERLDGRNLDVRAWTLVFFYAVTALGVFGLLRARRASESQLLALLAAYFTFVCVLSIAVPRLRSVFDGCMAIGAGLAIAWIVDRRAPVHADAPPVRSLRALTSIIVIGAIAAAGSASALVWRTHTRSDAQSSVAAALARDGSAVDALARQLQSSTRRGVPPQLQTADVDRLHDLVRTLGVRAPEASPALRQRIAAALPLVRVAAHEADVLGLLSAAEYLGASAAGRTPELASVVARYEHEARPADPTLEAWTDLSRGRAFRRSSAPLAALAAAVGETHS